MKTRFSTEVSFKNGRILRSAPIGLEKAIPKQVEAIEDIKPLLHRWLRGRVGDNEVLANSTIQVRCKYVETSNGLTVEFKIQSVNAK
jgi:hypothetical protein